jgi:D-beta-D-heptose 7-phosphate kinase/D-beta-D-heptose 1-phosphate adenosyltransferase
MSVDIDRFDRCRILVIGDLMIDHYVWGEVDRISPEAPVQVVSVTSEEDTLGGCGNVVNNIVALAGRVSLAGVVGDGADGDLLLSKCAALGVETEGVVREPGRPTTRKTRIFAANQHVLRIDRETLREIGKETFERLIAIVEKKIGEADVVVVSDYGKGTVTPALLERVTRAAAAAGRRIIADPKGIDFSRYTGVTVLTPNKKEAGLAAGIRITDDASLKAAADRLMNGIELESLLVTCGKEGMVLFERGREPFKIPAEARQIFEVSGAGDTVVAVLGLSLAAGSTLRSAAALANTAAGVVVGKVGTATLSRRELTAARDRVADPTAAKAKTWEELPLLAQELRKKGKRIVLTNGCFDLLHAGHVMLFSASKQLGDVLIVATDDDDSVRRLKGPGRPVIQARERMRILSALDAVDYVIEFTSDRLPELLDALRPDVLTKGSNYATEEVAGREMVEQFGGKVALIPIKDEISATRIIDSIRNGKS